MLWAHHNLSVQRTISPSIRQAGSSVKLGRELQDRHERRRKYDECDERDECDDRTRRDEGVAVPHDGRVRERCGSSMRRAVIRCAECSRDAQCRYSMQCSSSMRNAAIRREVQLFGAQCSYSVRNATIRCAVKLFDAQCSSSVRSAAIRCCKGLSSHCQNTRDGCIEKGFA